MKRKLLIKLFFATLPILIALIFYIITDPFLVLRKYDYDNIYMYTHLELNNDFYAVEKFKATNSTQHYETFLMGDSKTNIFSEKMLNKLYNCKSFYKSSCAEESIYGLYKKLKFFEKSGSELKNVMLGFDYFLFKEVENGKGHYYIKHPDITGESWFNFHLTNFVDVFKLEFLPLYLEDYKRDKSHPAKYDIYTLNEMAINSNADSFYDAMRKKLEFGSRSDTQQYYPHILGNKQLALLDSISAIFKRHNTNYHIVLLPEYDQKKLDPKDFALLDSIFGKRNIIDFTGINSITNNHLNFYDNHHFRPFVAEAIIDSIKLKSINVKE